jgi:hypothetical protein
MTSRLPPSDQHPVIPDERDMMSRGAKVDRRLDQLDGTLTQLALALRIIHKLRTMIPGTKQAYPDVVILDSFATDNGPADQIKRVENTYQISDGHLGS